MAHACAVCFSGTDENRMAFLLTTGLLTFMPLDNIAIALVNELQVAFPVEAVGTFTQVF